MVTAMCSSGLCFWYLELSSAYQRPAWGQGGVRQVHKWQAHTSIGLAHCLNWFGCPRHPQVQHDITHQVSLARASLHTEALWPHQSTLSQPGVHTCTVTEKAVTVR